MNENIDLTKILKDCPKGTKFYSTVYGDVTFIRINDKSVYPIVLLIDNNYYQAVTKCGKHSIIHEGECTLFPSKDQRNWTKFNAPWYKNEKFDPKTLKPFDKVIAMNDLNGIWHIQYFSHIEENCTYPFFCLCNNYAYCIPYNDDTKHLVGTTEEAPEFYKYWEN